MAVDKDDIRLKKANRPPKPPRSKENKGTELAKKIENSPFVKASKEIANAPKNLAKGADKVNKFAKALKKRLS